MKKTLLLIGLIGLLSSCNSTLNKKYSKQLVNTDFEKLKLNLDSVQLQNIKSGIHRLETAGKKLELMSYQEILNNELQHNSDKKKLIKTWDNYSTCSSQKEAKEYVELNCLGMFYSSVPPNSDIIKLIEIDGAEVYRNHGRIFIRLGDYVNWLTLKKNELGVWKFTMDEHPLLQEIHHWSRTTVGKIIYYTKRQLSAQEINLAQTFNQEFEDLMHTMDIYIDSLNYYMIDYGDTLALDIVGETNRNTGKAMNKTIKAIDIVNHTHELVHALALEIGLVNRFIDEGIATALGNSPLITTNKDKEEVINLLSKGYEIYLEQGIFTEAHMRGKNIYGLAQLTLQIWIDEYGFTPVKKVLEAYIEKQTDIKQLIEEFIEPVELTNQKLLHKLNSISLNE